MRQNIDINWPIHGHIKHYAEADELNLSEAYAEGLEAGLEPLANQDQQ